MFQIVCEADCCQPVKQHTCGLTLHATFAWLFLNFDSAQPQALCPLYTHEERAEGV